ncbi:MAG TPA: hypothetical protein DCG18_07755 [Richelia sp.]|nr:hypothetical protein [Richelia sp.]
MVDILKALLHTLQVLFTLTNKVVNYLTSEADIYFKYFYTHLDSLPQYYCGKLVNNRVNIFTNNTNSNIYRLFIFTIYRGKYLQNPILKTLMEVLKLFK